MPQIDGIFVSGTDTGVGKTAVSCWIVREMASRGVRVGACKPAATGAAVVDGRLVWEDAVLLASALGGAVDETLVTPIRLPDPLAPPVAARQQRKSLTLDDYMRAIGNWENQCDWLVVEGVGGLLCPITNTETVADLAMRWNKPLLIVARLGLGTLNHTLLTVEAASRRGLHVLGVVLNQPEPGAPTLADLTNPEELQRRLEVPVWGPIAHQSVDGAVPNVIREICNAILTGPSQGR